MRMNYLHIILSLWCTSRSGALLGVFLSVSKGAEWFNWEPVFLSSSFSAVCCAVVFSSTLWGNDKSCSHFYKGKIVHCLCQVV